MTANPKTPVHPLDDLYAMETQHKKPVQSCFSSILSIRMR
ncbi:MAG: DUF3158 family protein [Zoogloeaceae bacterium]|nr:DUF3158 family protein [Zoogloeaceae bacterium]